MLFAKTAVRSATNDNFVTFSFTINTSVDVCSDLLARSIYIDLSFVNEFLQEERDRIYPTVSTSSHMATSYFLTVVGRCSDAHYCKLSPPMLVFHASSNFTTFVPTSYRYDFGKLQFRGSQNPHFNYILQIEKLRQRTSFTQFSFFRCFLWH